MSTNTSLRKMEVFLVPLDPSKCPRQYKVTVPRNGTITDLCCALAEMANLELSKTKLLVTDVYNHRFHKIYTDNDSLMHILDRDDINVHQINNHDQDQEERRIVPVYLREVTNSSFSLFGQPFFIDVPRECSYELLYKSLLQVMSRYVQPPKHDLGRSTFRPFNVSTVNSYGKTETEGLSGNSKGDLIQLDERQYLSLDWYPASKLTYYNSSKADEFAQDHSVLCKVASKEDCSECSLSQGDQIEKTTQNIREDLEGTTREITEKILTKIDNLNLDLAQVNVPEIKKLDERFHRIIEDLNSSKHAELQKMMRAKEKEMQVIADKYNQEEENVDQSYEKKIELERKKYEDDKNALEHNSTAIKNEIMNSIDTLTDLLNKLEQPGELDANIRKDMECPICLNEMKPPVRIFQCSSGHLICEGCKDNLGTTKCPTCKEANIMGRANAVEQLARTLYRFHNQEE